MNKRESENVQIYDFPNFDGASWLRDQLTMVVKQCGIHSVLIGSQ